MKKKIVYISGAEIFDVADVRGALDEVRELLKLDRDTILFGVPVDTDAMVSEQETTDSNEEITTRTIGEIPNANIDDTEPEFIAETEQSNIPQDTVEPEITDIEKKSDEDTTVVPILSVLAAKTDDSVVEPEMIDGVFESNESVDNIKSDLMSDEIDTMKEDIVGTLDEDVPESKVEKTLEELLETMAPLREDIHVEAKDTLDTNVNIDETDITLENLAGEFAQAEEEMPVKKKSTERGKIGKLKNILPFTKKKRDDSGLMGDLFGWAGIAANDEDFSMPGFFANAKK